MILQAVTATSSWYKEVHPSAQQKEMLNCCTTSQRHARMGDTVRRNNCNFASAAAFGIIVREYCEKPASPDSMSSRITSPLCPFQTPGYEG
jgi:hypothetical protein